MPLLPAGKPLDDVACIQNARGVASVQGHHAETLTSICSLERGANQAMVSSALNSQYTLCPREFPVFLVWRGPIPASQTSLVK